MKAVKIKVPVNLTNGMEVPADSICIPSEFYLNIAAKTATKIPIQCPFAVYKSAAAYANGKRKIDEIQDFNTHVQDEITVADFETKDAETLAIKEIKQYLTAIYGSTNIDVINI